MERAAEASGGSGAPQLQFHNLVNNADIVPRLLGTSLDSLHGLLEAYLPMIQVWMAHFHHAFLAVLSVPAVVYRDASKRPLCVFHGPVHEPSFGSLAWRG